MMAKRETYIERWEDTEVEEEPMKVLKPEDHAFFLEHGYVVVKNVVPPAVMAEAIRELEQQEYSGRPGAGDYKPVRSDAVNACITKVVFDAVGEIFGDAYPYKRSPNATDMPRRYEPGADWKVPNIHIDEDYPTSAPNGDALSAFVFLTQVRSHGGAFVIADRSHNRCRAVMIENPEWLHFLRTDPAIAGEGEEYLAEPGDLLLFHHVFGHSGSSNVSDPQTRHALLARWQPERRIVPGPKPFDEMTTIEKANSPRYLRDIVGKDLRLLEPADDNMTNRILREGFAAAGGIRAHVSLRAGGVNHLFYVDDSSPSRVHHLRSEGWTDWTEADYFDLEGGVRTLQFFRSGTLSNLFAGIEAEAPTTHVYTSDDLQFWFKSAELKGMGAASPQYFSDFGSKITWGFAVIYPSSEQESSVEARWGPRTFDRELGAASIPEWQSRSVIANAGEGTVVLDAQVKHTGNLKFTLMLDTCTPDMSHASRLMAVQSADGLSYDHPPKEIAFAMPTPPRQVRVYASARDYWLVTYLREVEGSIRLFWGTIDWSEPDVALKEIGTVEELKEALYETALL